MHCDHKSLLWSSCYKCITFIMRKKSDKSKMRYSVKLGTYLKCCSQGKLELVTNWRRSKRHNNLNAMWDPRLDSGTEKGHSKENCWNLNMIYSLKYYEILTLGEVGQRVYMYSLCYVFCRFSVSLKLVQNQKLKKYGGKQEEIMRLRNSSTTLVDRNTCTWVTYII